MDSDFAGDIVLMHPPAFGRGSAQWPAVFAAIKQVGPLWETWKPSKTLDQMSIRSIWDCYNTGETVINAAGQPMGIKPPLRLVEQHFQSTWRNTSKVGFHPIGLQS